MHSPAGRGTPARRLPLAALPRAKSLIAALLAVVLCSACTTWNRTGPGFGTVPEYRLGTVRVTRLDLSTIILYNAAIYSDTVVGSKRAVDSSPDALQAIPLAEVRLVERKQVDPLRTGALIAAAPVVMIVMLVASFMGTGY